jgi:hypothetical protein
MIYFPCQPFLYLKKNFAVIPDMENRIIYNGEIIGMYVTGFINRGAMQAVRSR